MIHSVSQEIKSALLYCKTTTECWNKLKVRYAQTNDVRIFHLQQEMSILVQGNSSVTDFFTKLPGYWEELEDYRPLPVCSCKDTTVTAHLEKIQDVDKIFKFLMGLNKSFDMVRGQIFLIDPKPTLDKAYSLVLQEERQKMSRENYMTPAEASTMNVGFKRKENLSQLP